MYNFYYNTTLNTKQKEKVNINLLSIREKTSILNKLRQDTILSIKNKINSLSNKKCEVHRFDIKFYMPTTNKTVFRIHSLSIENNKLIIIATDASDISYCTTIIVDNVINEEDCHHINTETLFKLEKLFY